MGAAAKNLLPGMPAEVVSHADMILSKLHELYNDNGAFSPVKVLFVVMDDQHQHHDLHFVFDAARGDGEYVLVPG